jgi:hypothetical protein
MATEEAISQSGIGSRGDFPGPLFMAVAPVELEWEQREALVRASGANDSLGTRYSAYGRDRPVSQFLRTLLVRLAR